MSRTHRILGLRLTEDESARLDALCSHLGLGPAATMRSLFGADDPPTSRPLMVLSLKVSATELARFRAIQRKRGDSSDANTMRALVMLATVDTLGGVIG